MAELYDQKKIYAKLPTAQPAEGVDGELEAMLAELPPEERDAARQHITAAPTGEDINRAMQERNANGEVFNMNLDQYRLWKAYNKNKETDIIETMGQAAGGVFDEIMKAGGSIVDDPTGAAAKLTPSLIEAFAQGTRNLYGMAAQSQDPSSVFFRVKNALSANGDDEAAEFQQFMDAQAFNVHSMRLASGQDTLVMDKDVINPEMTQVMSYIADPTLFVPFGGIAAKGARLVGMGEGLAKASARAAQIQRKILGGTLKWGVGAPIEFLGTATRNTIDYGLERAGTAFETVTGMSAAEAKTSLNLYGQYSVSAALEGRNVALPIAGDIAGAMVGSTTAKGVGESISMIGEQMLKQQKHGRGVLSYAGQALRDAEKSGVPLSKHARALLNVIDKADPLFVYSADLAKGAGEGMFIGGFLGGLSGGEEGLASGAGAGLALGTVGAGLGSVVSDIGNGRLYDRIAVQRQMVIEGLRQVDPAKASAFEALVAAVETTGNRDYIAQTDGIIAGIDLAAPNAKFNIRDTASHIEWLRSQKIDPDTGRLMEPSAILPEFGGDRKARGKVLSFLGMANERFKSKDELLGFLKTVPQDHALRREFFRLDDKQKQVVFDTLGKHQDAEYRKQFGNKSAGEFYKDLNYGEANVARVNAMFDSGNKTRANEMIRQMLKDETVNGQLTERGKLLKEKLATEGYFDKDGNMRPSRLKDVELTAEAYANSAGFVIRRDSTGQVEININLDAFGRDTVPHELFHAIMMESAFKPDFTDRLAQNLLGKFDANGKMIERPSVDTAQVKKFFARYIDALHGRNPIERDNEIKRLDSAIKEYESRGTTNKIAEAGNNTLETMVEEFGAYYFGKFINDKPVDFLFRGGELGAMREMLGNAKQGWLDFWRSKIKGQNPTLDFDNIQGTMITTGFGKNGVRARVTALDLFMRDFVRATAMANRNGAFDVSRLSPEAQRTFIKNQGIRVYGNPDANGRIGRKTQRQILSEQIVTGKEIYKILSGLDPELRKGLTIDGEGNLSGRLSPEAMEAIVQSGKIDRAWVDKIQNAYNILDGKGSNIIYFGYLGRTAQIGDYAWPRLVGNAVPFKNRAAVLLDVDFKVGKDGKMSALFHTLDKAVIDGRADVLWSDSAIRQLWDNDRAAMEADFFRYLSNASLPSSDPNRVPSARLLEDGTGKGAMRRNALHQMLGMVKPEGDVYLNKPIAEIPYGIRHSVTTFSVDGISNMRVASGGRWDIVPQNAFRDLARNFQPAEMTREQTPKGSIIKHASGFKFSESGNKVVAYTSVGRKIGIYDDIYSASVAAKNEYNKVYDNIEKGTQDSVREQDKIVTKFQPLERAERDEAVRLGDVFALPSMKAFVGDRPLLRQTREEHIYQRALEASKNPEQLLALAEQVSQRNQQIDAEYKRLEQEWNKKADEYENYKSSIASPHYRKIGELKKKYAIADSYEEWKFSQRQQGKWNPPEMYLPSPEWDLNKKKNPDYTEYEINSWNKYDAKVKDDYSRFLADPEYIAEMESFKIHEEQFRKTANELIAEEEALREFRMKNSEALNDPILEQLNSALLENTTREEKANLFAGLVEASAKQKDYSGLLEAMFAGEYDSQIQTGKPFVAVTTHGTGSVELMLSRLFAADKLGSHYDIPSSRMGSFSAGSQNTSKSYARVNNTFKGTPLYKTSKLVLDYASGKDIKVGTSAINFLSAHTDFFREYKKAYEADYVRLNEEAKQYMSSIDRDEYFNELKNEILDLTIGQIEYRISKKQDSKGAVSALAKMQLHFEEIFGKQNNAPMQLRKVIRMDNPYVVVDPRSYEEHYISPHMKRAMEAGHDGIVFKRFADGGERDNVYVVFKDFMKDNIKVIDTSFDDAGVPRGTDNYGRVLKGGKELGLKFQPTERDAGGRVYDQNSDEFKSGFIGLWASKNPEKLKDKNIEFVKRKDGSYRITMTDNSGETQKVGHITATIDDSSMVAGEGVAEISSNIDPKFRGQKLANVLYSEMAERLRSMGIRYVDGTIVNKEGVPVQVRNTVIGQTYYKGNNRPAFRDEAAKKIQALQSVYPSKGVGVYNELDPKARYQPSEKEKIIKRIDDKASMLSEKIKELESQIAKRMPFVTKGEHPKQNKESDKIYRELLLRKKDAESDLRILTEKKRRMIELKEGFATTDYQMLDGTPRYQPAEEGGRTYTKKQMDGEFIGRWSEENPNLKKGLKLFYGEIKGGMGQEGLTLRDKQGEVVANIRFERFGDDVSIEKADVNPKHQRKGYGYLVYSELLERLRSEGVKTVSGMVIDNAERPIKIRKRVIDVENLRLGQWDLRTQILDKRYDQEGNKQIDVESYLHQKARYQPREEVVQRAKEAGYGTTLYYHGTNKDFNEFKSSPRNHSVGASEGRESGNMFFLSSDPLDAEHYKKAWVGDKDKTRVITAFVKLDNPYDVSANGKQIPFTPEQEAILKRYIDKYSRHPNKEWQLMQIIGQQKRGVAPLFQLFERNERAAMLKEMGYDGIKDGRHIAVFDSEQIKSADDFTYDDQGREIPLEERFNKNKKDIRYQPAERDAALVQNGFEKSELNKRLVDSGHIVLGFDERELAGKAVVINNPDTMMTGTLETPSGRILAEGEGGLNFVSKFGDIWANSKESKARTTARNLQKAQKENGGVAYLSLTRGSFENALNSHTGAKAGMGILEYFVEQGYISLEEFRNALKDSGRKYGIEFNATQSAKAIHAEIASKFFGVSDSTFERRGDFVKDVITHLAENGESGHKNIDKISNALGAERLGKKIQFAPTGIREAIGLMLSDKRANVDPSHVYAYIEVTGNISVEKTENGHKSYPWHIVQRDENGNKIRPRMLIPDKTNYVTDVFLNKEKKEVPRKGGATKLGSNQVGEAYGYVKEASLIPEGKERLKWQPAEGFRDWKAEQTTAGSLIKNSAGYVISRIGSKYKVYNPYKAIIGVYDNEEQAKRRVQREEPKQ